MRRSVSARASAPINEPFYLLEPGEFSDQFYVPLNPLDVLRKGPIHFAELNEVREINSISNPCSLNKLINEIKESVNQARIRKQKLIKSAQNMDMRIQRLNRTIDLRSFDFIRSVIAIPELIAQRGEHHFCCFHSVEQRQADDRFPSALALTVGTPRFVGDIRRSQYRTNRSERLNPSRARRAGLNSKHQYIGGRERDHYTRDGNRQLFFGPSPCLFIPHPARLARTREVLSLQAPCHHVQRGAA